VTLTVSAQSNLTRTPASLTFTHQVGSPSPAAQSVSVSSAGAALAFSAAASTNSGGNWLSVSPASAMTPATLVVSVNPAGLAAGTYSGAITLTSAAAGNSPQTVGVTLTVSAQSNLTRTPASLTFTHLIGSPSPVLQSISVSSAGAALAFSATASTTSGGSWLSVSPASATTPAALAVSVNPAGLGAGTYSGAVTLTSP